jgi:NAD(P)-dependent dehydrogenase (short-subunit alcohol dehydrogenase family)
MGKELDVESLLKFTADRFGRLDVLVNNHAPVAEMVDDRRDLTLTETKSKDWEYILHHGLTSFYYSIKYSLPLMLKNNGGSIVNISALASTRGSPGLSTYAAAKGGINAMTRQLAADYGKQSIRVNTILVGTIISNERMETAWSNPRLRTETEKLVCVNRLGNAEDIAYTALFLASDRAGYISGSEVTVDGGQSIKLAIPSLDEGWDAASGAASSRD